MKSFEFSNNTIRNTSLVILLLVSVTIGIMIGCGKLKDDERPGTPVGTSSGGSIPIGHPDSLGTYSLALTVHPPYIPADGVTFATVKAILEDSSGRSLQNFMISFNTTSSDTACVFMMPPAEPGGAASYSTTIEGRTGEDGKVSVLLYGTRSGSCIIQATSDIDEDGAEDLFTTTSVIVTGGTGKPGDAIAGVDLTADNTFKSENVGTCGEDSTEIEFTLYADVWDAVGIKVGSGVRVEFKEVGVLIGWAETDTSGRATVTVSSGTLFPTTSAGVSRSRTITAEVIIDGKTYTDTITVTATATCTVATPLPTVTPTATPTPVTVTLVPSASVVPAGGTTSTVSVFATVGALPVPDGTQIQFTATVAGAFFTSSVSNVATRTTTGGIAQDTLNYPILVGRPTPITVNFVVTSPGYSGTGSIIVTFN